MAIIPTPGSMIYRVEYPAAQAIFVEKVRILYKDRKAVERVQDSDLGIDICEDCADQLALKAAELDFAANTIIDALGLKCPNCARKLNSSCYDQTICTTCKAMLQFAPIEKVE